jgi:hypothetical protein
MSSFFRFPHTPHLAWLGRGEPRDDKVLSPAEAATLLGGDLVVEEKLDGANIGFSLDDEGQLRVQNRGSYLQPGESAPQFRPLWPWVARHTEALEATLGASLMLFGEWCLAVHSVRYAQLPDWFLGFDVYDLAAGRFWDTQRRNTLLGQLGLPPVPRVARGRFTLSALSALVAESAVGGGPMEGVVVRCEAEGWTHARAKLVSPQFTQAIEGHWSRGRLERNQLAVLPA